MYKEKKSYLNERNRRKQLQRRRKKRKIWNTAVTLTLSALLFGTVAGSSGYAVEQYLVKKETKQQQYNIQAVTQIQLYYHYLQQQIPVLISSV